MGLAVDPASGDLFVGSRFGVERFDPATMSFKRFSRDQNLRVGSLAFSRDGVLYGVQWPQRDAVLKFSPLGRAETVMTFETPIDSIAFGQPDSPLDGLMFISHNSGRSGFGSTGFTSSVVGDRNSELTMVDVTTLRRIALATGGSRGDVVRTTVDGRVLVSQSDSVDVLSPITEPQVVATRPAEQTVVALPMGMPKE